MSRIAFPLGARARRRAIRCVLAGVAAFFAPPALAQAPECKIEETVGSIAVSDILDVMGRNLECLEQRIEVLRGENATLRARLDVVEDERGAAGAAYRNVNGAVDRKDRYLGPATFVLTGDRAGGSRSLPIDHALLLAMCGDADGCLLTLGITGTLAAGEPVETMFAEGPCVLHLDGDAGTWSLSGLCAQTPLPEPNAPVSATSHASAPGETLETAGTRDSEGTEPAPEIAEALPAKVEQVGPRWGRDGSARPFGSALQQGRIVLGFAGACLLTEAAPERRRFGTSAPRLGRDTETDFFLVTTGTDWDPAGAFPTASLPLRPRDPDFDCRLTLRD